MNIYEIIVRPLETEKSYLMREDGKYVFMVHNNANKNQIKQAVQDIYGVKVKGVNVMNMPGKQNSARGRRRSVRRAPWKKAVVTLAAGQTIDALEA